MIVTALIVQVTVYFFDPNLKLEKKRLLSSSRKISLSNIMIGVTVLPKYFHAIFLKLRNGEILKMGNSIMLKKYLLF